MLLNTLQSIFTRDVSKLRSEIELYKTEENIWKTEKNIPNSAGNLCLHLIGNLNAHIGKVIGKTDYVRNRDLEFSLQHVPRNELLSKIDDTIKMIQTVLQNVKEDDMRSEYPVPVFDEPVSTEYMLIHLATHLNYHVGQINYHRRLLD